MGILFSCFRQDHAYKQQEICYYPLIKNKNRTSHLVLPEPPYKCNGFLILG